MKQKSLLAVALMSLAFASCGEQDLYDPEYNPEYSEFEANFVKKFGKVSPTQSWDLSSDAIKYTTRAGGYGFTTSDDYLTIDQNSIKEFFDKVPGGHDNTSLGKPFIMTVPNNEFTIVPMFADAGLEWELCLVVGDVETRIWGKGENMMRRYNNGEWKTWSSPFNTDKSITVKNNWGISHTYNYEYCAKSYTFNTKENPLPVGEKMYFTLKITKTNGLSEKEYGKIGTATSSVDGHMLALDLENRPSFIPEGFEYKVIGCEDVNMSNRRTNSTAFVSDKDINDLIFCVYGNPKVPEQIEIKDGEPIVRTVEKRYMIEDLGSTDDFDFNDVVVDVKETREETPVLTNGVVTSWKFTEWKQTATIRHLGGTIPFRLQIGDTKCDWMNGVLDKDVEITFDVTGWDPNENNIICASKHEDNKSGNVRTLEVKFPKEGEVPMIIATKTTQNWMPERESIPESWWK